MRPGDTSARLFDTTEIHARRAALYALGEAVPRDGESDEHDFFNEVPGLTEDKCVTLIGMAGAGKSTVGRAVAERLGWAYVDTDHLIESTYGARFRT